MVLQNCSATAVANDIRRAESQCPACGEQCANCMGQNYFAKARERKRLTIWCLVDRLGPWTWQHTVHVLLWVRMTHAKEASVDHDRHLHALMAAIWMRHSTKLSPYKPKLRQSEALIAGHEMTADRLNLKQQVADGRSWCPDKCHDDASAWRCAQNMQIWKFWGMVNFLCCLISDKCNVLHQLTKSDAMWQWDSNHQKAFNEIKALLTEPLYLPISTPKPQPSSVKRHPQV